MEGVARLHRRHLRDLIALLRRGAHTGQALQEGEDGLRQALLGDYWGSARGHVLRQVYRNGDLADVEGTLLFREIIPVGIRGNDDFPLAVRILAQVEGILIHLVRRICHEVAMPQQGRRGAQELGLIGSGVQAGEGLVRCRTLLQQRIRGGLLEAGKQVGHWLVLRGNTCHGHWTRDDAHLVGGVALILGLPQGIFAKPGLQVTIDGRYPRHGLDVLVVQRNPPGGIARGDLRNARGGVFSQQLRDGLRCIVHSFHSGEEGFNLAVVSRIQAGLDAVEEIQEAVIPARIHKGMSQLHKTLEPLGVGHGLYVAEVGLTGLG